MCSCHTNEFINVIGNRAAQRFTFSHLYILGETACGLYGCFSAEIEDNETDDAEETDEGLSKQVSRDEQREDERKQERERE